MSYIKNHNSDQANITYPAVQWYNTLPPYEESLNDREYMLKEIIPYLIIRIGLEDLLPKKKGQNYDPSSTTPIQPSIKLDLTNYELHRLQTKIIPSEIDYIIVNASINKNKDLFYAYFNINGFIQRTFFESIRYIFYDQKLNSLRLSKDEMDMFYMLMFSEVSYVSSVV